MQELKTNDESLEYYEHFVQTAYGIPYFEHQ